MEHIFKNLWPNWVYDENTILRNAVIYGIYDTTKQELLYIGSTMDFDRRKKDHERNLKRANVSTRLYDYIRNMSIDWYMAIIEKYPCPTNGHLLFREYQLIEERRPWYNGDRIEIIHCRCGRFVKGNSKCRLCELVDWQVENLKYQHLVPTKAKGIRTCCICNGITENSQRSKEDLNGMCFKCFSEVECEMFNQGWTAVDVCVEHDDCPFLLVKISWDNDRVTSVNPVHKREHDCVDECFEKLDEMKNVHLVG